MAGVDKKRHKRVWVKVNAPVDEGVADLVAVLNKVDGLETIASCQGWKGAGEAYVYFYFGTWERISRFAFKKIAPALEGIEGAAISVEIFNGSNPMGKLRIRAEALSVVTSALSTRLLFAL